MKQYRALTRLSLRTAPGADTWLTWELGDVFSPPKHMAVKPALAEGLIEEVNDD